MKKKKIKITIYDNGLKLKYVRNTFKDMKAAINFIINYFQELLSSYFPED